MKISARYRKLVGTLPSKRCPKETGLLLMNIMMYYVVYGGAFPKGKRSFNWKETSPTGWQKPWLRVRSKGVTKSCIPCAITRDFPDPRVFLHRPAFAMALVRPPDKQTTGQTTSRPIVRNATMYHVRFQPYYSRSCVQFWSLLITIVTTLP